MIKRLSRSVGFGAPGRVDIRNSQSLLAPDHYLCHRDPSLASCLLPVIVEAPRLQGEGPVGKAHLQTQPAVPILSSLAFNNRIYPQQPVNTSPLPAVSYYHSVHIAFCQNGTLYCPFEERTVQRFIYVARRAQLQKEGPPGKSISIRRPLFNLKTLPPTVSRLSSWS